MLREHSRRRRVALPFVLTLLPVWTALGCASTPAPVSEAKEDETEDLDREVVLARMRLEVAELRAGSELRKAEYAVETATAAVEKARLSLEQFDAAGRDMKLGRAQLSLDRAAYRAQEAEEELGELESMYSKEEFAETTKELVLTRGRMQLEFAQRGLELEQRALEQLAGHELTTEQRDRTRALRDAEDQLAGAETSLSTQRIEGEIAVREAKQKLEEQKKEKKEKAEGEDSKEDAK